ncbi:hypothetical protein LEP1GSC070_2112 [Leptospira santarosai str. AIM]|nr:hypothetical protein LEP1GSC070_2112 [Leptospira santarosai str. AIM]
MVLCNKIAEGLDTRYIGESSVIEFLLEQVSAFLHRTHVLS